MEGSNGRRGVPGTGRPQSPGPVGGWSPDFAPRVAAEPSSTVTFDIEPMGEKVGLTVTHDGFPEGSEVLPMISGGWPSILSGLKTLLETGEALPDDEAE